VSEQPGPAQSPRPSGRPRTRALGSPDAGARLKSAASAAGLANAALASAIKAADPEKPSADPGRTVRTLLSGEYGPTPDEAVRLADILNIPDIATWWEWPAHLLPPAVPAPRPVPDPPAATDPPHLPITPGPDGVVSDDLPAGDSPRRAERPARFVRDAAAAVVVVVLLAIGWAVFDQVRRSPGRSVLPGPATAGPATSDPATPAGEEPAFSYLQKATAPGQDIDVAIEPGGYVAQTFTATGSQLAAVTVIVSRDQATTPAFRPERIGHVRLQLRRVSTGQTVGESIPLQPVDGEPAEEGSVRVMAGPNHRDTVIKLDPIRTTPGERYAFVVTNDEPGVALSFSLRPGGAPGDRAYWDGARQTSNAPLLGKGRSNRAVAGFVCNVPAGC
jgi:hypothetical protein